MTRSTAEVVGRLFEAELAAVFLSRLGGDDFSPATIEKHWQEYAPTYVGAADARAATDEDRAKITRAVVALNSVHGGYAWPDSELS